MNQRDSSKIQVATDIDTNSSTYVPTLQRTEGQPPPIAANGGLSYMSFDRERRRRARQAAMEAALASRSPGAPAARGHRDARTPRPRVRSRPNGVTGFRDYEECMALHPGEQH